MSRRSTFAMEQCHSAEMVALASTSMAATNASAAYTSTARTVSFLATRARQLRRAKITRHATILHPVTTATVSLDSLAR